MGNIVATLGAGVVKPVTYYPTSSGPLVELVAQEHARPTDQLQYPQCISTSPVRTQTTATEPQSKRTMMSSWEGWRPSTYWQKILSPSKDNKLLGVPFTYSCSWSQCWWCSKQQCWWPTYYLSTWTGCFDMKGAQMGQDPFSSLKWVHLPRSVCL